MYDNNIFIEDSKYVAPESDLSEVKKGFLYSAVKSSMFNFHFRWNPVAKLSSDQAKPNKQNSF